MKLLYKGLVSKYFSGGCIPGADVDLFKERKYLYILKDGERQPLRAGFRW